MADERAGTKVDEGRLQQDTVPILQKVSSLGTAEQVGDCGGVFPDEAAAAVGCEVKVGKGIKLGAVKIGPEAR